MVNVAYSNSLVLFLIHFIFCEIFLQGVKHIYVEITVRYLKVPLRLCTLSLLLLIVKICLEEKDQMGKSTIPSLTHMS